MCTTYVYIPTYLLTYLHTYMHKRFPCFGSKKFLPFQAKKKNKGICENPGPPDFYLSSGAFNTRIRR